MSGCNNGNGSTIKSKSNHIFFLKLYKKSQELSYTNKKYCCSAIFRLISTFNYPSYIYLHIQSTHSKNYHQSKGYFTVAVIVQLWLNSKSYLKTRNFVTHSTTMFFLITSYVLINTRYNVDVKVCSFKTIV